MTRQLTRRDIVGSPTDWLLSALIILGPPLFFIWSMGAFPLLDQNDPILIVGVAAGFVGGSVLSALKRRTIFRWADQFPGFSWGGVVGLGAVTAAGFVGALITLNGLLDRHAPTTREYVVVRRSAYNGHSLRVALPDSGVSGYLDIDVSEGEYEQSGTGSHVAIDVKPGFLGRPWVTGHRLIQ